MAALLSVSVASATPACPPGTVSAPHLGWYFVGPAFAGLVIGAVLLVMGVRQEPKSTAKIGGGVAVSLLGIVAGGVLFFMNLWRCVPQ